MLDLLYHEKKKKKKQTKLNEQKKLHEYIYICMYLEKDLLPKWEGVWGDWWVQENRLGTKWG
jgi:hypothetical protein